MVKTASRHAAHRSDKEKYTVVLVPFDDGSVYISISPPPSSFVEDTRETFVEEEAIVASTEDALQLIRLALNSTKAR